MTPSNHIRIVLALVLATCSPTWCRCMLMASTMEQAALTTSRTAQRALESAGLGCNDDACGLHAHDAVTMNGACCEGSDHTEHSEIPGNCECACCDRSLSFAPSVADAALTCVLVHAVDVLAIRLQLLPATIGDSSVSMSLDGDPPKGLSPTPVDRHCLLLI